MRKLVGNREIEDSLQRLDTLTQEEARMASAESLKVTHDVNAKVRDVEGKLEDVQGDMHAVRNQVQDVDNGVQGIGSEVREASSSLSH